MKKTLLVNPPSPWLIKDNVLVPLGLMYVAGEARNQGLEAKILDLSGGKFEKIKDLPIEEPDVIGVGFTSPHSPYVKNAVADLRKRFPNAAYVAGGIHPTAMPEHALGLGFDYVFTGESETDFANAVKRDFKDTPKITRSRPRQDLDSLVFPARDLIDMKEYMSDMDVFEYMGDGTKLKQSQIIATRGCPYSCSFCAEGLVNEKNLRWRSVDNIREEIKDLKDTYGVNMLRFIDDNLTIKKPWLKELTEMLKDEKMYWSCLGRTDGAKLEDYQRMADSGCLGIDFGVESGSNKLLKLIRKGTTAEKQEAGIRLAKQAGLKTRAQFIIGLPQETDEDFQKSYDFVKRNLDVVDKWGFHTFVPLPGCEIFTDPGKFAYVIGDHNNFENYHTCGKPGEWDYKPVEGGDKIRQRQAILSDLVKNYNIQKK